MTGFACDFGGHVIFHQAFAFPSRRQGVNPPGDIVQRRCVTAHASKIFAVHAHVDVQGLVRVGQGSVQVAVFDAIAAAAVKVTGTAVFATGTANTLGSLF